MPSRKTHLHLKGTRIRFKHGSFYYIGKDDKWHRLGKTMDSEAWKKHSELSKGTVKEGTVGKLLDDFLTFREKEVKGGKISKRTYEDNLIEARALKNMFREWHYKEIERPDVKAYLNERFDVHTEKRAPIRANREIALLSSAYSWAMGELGYVILENPCYGVRRNRESPRTRYVTGQELRAFGRSAPKWLRIYCLLKYLTGLRQGDMLKLTRQNVKHGRLVVETGKTKKGLKIRKTWAVKVAINAILSLHGEVPKMNLFVNRYGEPMTSRGFKSAWQRAMQKWAKLGHGRFWEHDIRGATADASEDAQTLLGHGSPKMTARYKRAPAKVDPIR